MAPRVRPWMTISARARNGNAAMTSACAAPNPGSADAATIGCTVTLSIMTPGPRRPWTSDSSSTAHAIVGP
jgi:hypothetical protein